MLLIRPKVSSQWLSFTHTGANIREGYRATAKALEHFDAYLDQHTGVFPRKRIRLDVARDKCIKCGLCVALAPETMRFDHDGTAVPQSSEVEWSSPDGDFVRHCPTDAITATRLDLVAPDEPDDAAAVEDFVIP